jgi:hypothetical protein
VNRYKTAERQSAKREQGSKKRQNHRQAGEAFVFPAVFSNHEKDIVQPQAKNQHNGCGGKKSQLDFIYSQHGHGNQYQKERRHADFKTIPPRVQKKYQGGYYKVCGKE